MWLPTSNHIAGNQSYLTVHSIKRSLSRHQWPFYFSVEQVEPGYIVSKLVRVKSFFAITFGFHNSTNWLNNCSQIWMIVLRYCAGVMAWTTVVLVNLLFIACTIFAYERSGLLGKAGEVGAVRIGAATNTLIIYN